MRHEIVLTNDFHRTETVVRPRADGTITARTLHRVWRDNCGMPECACGGVRGGDHWLEDVEWDESDRPTVLAVRTGHPMDRIWGTE